MKSKVLLSIIIFIFVSTAAFANTFDLKKERIGKLFYGMTDIEVKKTLGKPTSASKAELVHATGDWEQLWQYKSLGVKLGLCATKENGPALLCKIDVEAPSQMTTSRGIHIGSTENDVKKAYQDEINIEESSFNKKSQEKTIVIGSIYGGVLFTIKKDKVSEIFIGAAAE